MVNGLKKYLITNLGTYDEILPFPGAAEADAPKSAAEGGKNVCYAHKESSDRYGTSFKWKSTLKNI